MKHTRRSEYTKNILMLLSGNTVAQAIPIVISPILTRIYTPEDFGVIGLFLSIVLLLGSISTGQYSTAIPLVHKDEDVYSVISVSIIFAFIISVCLFLFVLLFHTSLVSLLGNEEISTWLYIIPFVVFLMGIFNILTFYKIRNKDFKDLSLANVYKSLSSGVFQIILGIFKEGAFGLVVGSIVSNIVSNWYLLRKFKFSKLSFYTLKNIAILRRYKEFPIYYLPNNLVYNLTGTLTVVLISSFFGIAVLGFFNMANKILGLPSSLLGNAISQVYLQKASEDRKKGVTIMPIFLETLKKLVLVSLPIFFLFYVSLEEIFSFVFGKEWYVAGYYGEILTPLFFARFIRASLNTTIVVLEKQKIGLMVNILLLFATMMVFTYAFFYDISTENLLKVLTFVLSMLNILIIYIYYHLIKNYSLIKKGKI